MQPPHRRLVESQRGCRDERTTLISLLTPPPSGSWPGQLLRVGALAEQQSRRTWAHPGTSQVKVKGWTAEIKGHILLQQSLLKIEASGFPPEILGQGTGRDEGTMDGAM